MDTASVTEIIRRKSSAPVKMEEDSHLEIVTAMLSDKPKTVRHTRPFSSTWGKGDRHRGTGAMGEWDGSLVLWDDGREACGPS